MAHRDLEPVGTVVHWLAKPVPLVSHGLGGAERPCRLLVHGVTSDSPKSLIRWWTALRKTAATAHRKVNP